VIEMSKGDFHTNPDEIVETAPPDFCAQGVHSDEIVVTDIVERVCNDCGRREEVQPDECVQGADWFPEHDYHFGVCRRCDAEESDE
jgi:hypothetical protein